MFDDIISVENLSAAWRKFRRGKRDRSDVQVFERRLEDNIFALNDELRMKCYRHGSYERFHVFDPKHRIIHKAGVRDRVIHHALYRVLVPLFERCFIFDSYSCRLGKGTHAAVERLGRFARKVSQNYTRPCFVLKCDIRKFFDSIDHAILLRMFARRVADMDTLWLLSEIVERFSASTGFERERERVKGCRLEISPRNCLPIFV